MSYAVAMMVTGPSGNIAVGSDHGPVGRLGIRPARQRADLELDPLDHAVIGDGRSSGIGPLTHPPAAGQDRHTGAWMSRNLAATSRWPAMSSAHDAEVPVQAPVQPSKRNPAAGAAVSVAGLGQLARAHTGVVDDGRSVHSIPLPATPPAPEIETVRVPAARAFAGRTRTSAKARRIERTSTPNSPRLGGRLADSWRVRRAGTNDLAGPAPRSAASRCPPAAPSRARHGGSWPRRPPRRAAPRRAAAPGAA